MKIKRIAPGAYELTGAKGEYLIDQHTEGWYLTYPGRLRADDVYSTLRTAKAAAIYFDQETDHAL